jgi:hypothetical protein
LAVVEAAFNSAQRGTGRGISPFCWETQARCKAWLLSKGENGWSARRPGTLEIEAIFLAKIVELLPRYFRFGCIFDKEFNSWDGAETGGPGKSWKRDAIPTASGLHRYKIRTHRSPEEIRRE